MHNILNCTPVIKLLKPIDTDINKQSKCTNVEFLSFVTKSFISLFNFNPNKTVILQCLRDYFQTKILFTLNFNWVSICMRRSHFHISILIESQYMD